MIDPIYVHGNHLSDNLDAILSDVDSLWDDMFSKLLNEADSMVGRSDFPALCRSLVGMCADPEKTAALQQVIYRRAYLFFCDKGRGYNHALKLLRKLHIALGLLAPEAVCVSCEYSPVTGLTREALDALKNPDVIVSVDLSDAPEEVEKAGFQSVLQQIRGLSKDQKNIVVFRLPYQKREQAKNAFRSFNWFFTAEPVVFQPLTERETLDMAKLFFQQLGWSLTPGALKEFSMLVRYARENGAFYGSHTVRKLVDDIVSRTLAAEKRGDSRRIGVNDIRAARPFPELYEGAGGIADQPSFESAMRELDGMVGMAEVRRKVEEIIRSMKFAQLTGSSAPGLHMVLTGNPGTGKTTVARVIAKALKASGILSVGKCVECSTTDLIAQYVGQTAVKTRELCKSAYGSVLFIDEAYMLMPERGGGDFAAEALAELIAQMENHRDKLVVIMAGYAEEMEKMLEGNTGMKRRIPYQIHIPNCDPAQLTAIYFRLLDAAVASGAGKGYQIKYAKDLPAHVEKFFNSIPERVLRDRAFGNGGYARNLLDQTIVSALGRANPGTVADMDLSVVLETEDFDCAAAGVSQR